MEALTIEFKKAAQGFGADLIGVARMDRFDGVPAERHPASIFPDARAVVVLGRRITRGTVQAIEQGTNWQTYELFGYHWLDTEFLALTVFEAVEWLEDRGWEACPLFPFPPEAPPQGVPVREGQPAPNVFPDLEHAAVAAGLGEIGWCGVLLTPQFGPLQRLQMILTDAPLDPDPLFQGELCSRCGVCAVVCPLNAIDRDNEEVVKVAGREFTVAKVNYSRCRRCPNGALPNRYHGAGKPDRLGALCVRSCLAMLDEAGKLTGKFHQLFRRREYWALDALGDVVTPQPWQQVRATGCADPSGFRAMAEGREQ
jgi:ferredoxin